LGASDGVYDKGTVRLALDLALFAVLIGIQGRPAAKTERAQGKGDKPSTELTRVQKYFATCDYDASGYLTFSEANASLGIDRDGWKAYDEDNDGRISEKEFSRRYEAILATGGAFNPPTPKADARASIPERAEDALASYDKNRDKGLDMGEIDFLLVEIGAIRMEAETSIDQFDRDLTRKLEVPELEDLLALLRPDKAKSKGPRPRSLNELFGKLVPRTLQEGSTPQPVRITPPVLTFRRLDIDADGGISLEDLSELQRPLVLPVRAGAVLAALDANGDGTVDETEFRAAMRSGP
jgi:Ca2+-binding EF-hand superfamily protein